jgi:hypothetical protein
LALQLATIGGNEKSFNHNEMQQLTTKFPDENPQTPAITVVVCSLSMALASFRPLSLVRSLRGTLAMDDSTRSEGAGTHAMASRDPAVNNPRLLASVTDSLLLVDQGHHVVGVGERVVIFFLGWFLGMTFLGPNIMMSDSGTPRARRAATVGMWASILFCIGGCVGAFQGWWMALLPGALFQVVALVMLPAK